MTVLTNTDPYPWPYDGVVDPARLALVVCGAQAGLAAACAAAAEVLVRLGPLADRCRAAGAAVVWLRHGGLPGRRQRPGRADSPGPPGRADSPGPPGPPGPPSRADSPGPPDPPSPPSGRPSLLPAAHTPAWSLLIDPHPSDLVVDAAGWDGCYGSRLDDALRRHGRDHVALCGLAAELTVDSTVRTLNDRGYECLVLTDACAPVDDHTGHHAQRSLTMSGGIFGALGTSGALVTALTEQETPA